MPLRSFEGGTVASAHCEDGIVSRHHGTKYLQKRAKDICSEYILLAVVLQMCGKDTGSCQILTPRPGKDCGI